jgi:O-antigen ligase
MTLMLFLLCGLVWLLITVYHVNRRGYVVLLIWLFVAPVAANLVNEPGTNPFFSLPRVQEEFLAVSQPRSSPGSAYATAPTTIKVQELFEPTRLLFCIFFGVFLLNTILHKRTVPLDRVETWMLAFSLVLFIGAFRSMRFAFSLRTAIDAFVVPFLAYYVARRLVTSEERLQRLTQVVGYMAIYHLMIAIVERLSVGGLYYRLGTTFRHHNPLSFVMVMLFLFMLADTLRGVAFADDKPTFPRSARFFALCLAPLIVLLTWNRANWVAFFMSTGVFVFLSRRLTSPTRKYALIGLLLIFFSAAALSLQAPALQMIAEERVTQRVGTVYSRIGAWILVMQEVSTAPLFGIGLNDLRFVLSTTHIGFMGGRSETSAHNSYLSLFAELGIVGLLMYVAIVIAMIQMGLRLYRNGPLAQDHWRGVTIVGIMVAYLVPALFGNTLYLKTVSHVYLYAYMGAIAGLYSQRPSQLYVSSGRQVQMSPGLSVQQLRS